MLLPSKYENLDNNLMVIGAEAISYLKKKNYNVEELYQLLKKEKRISLEQYFDCLTFLWLSEILELENFGLKLVRET